MTEETYYKDKQSGRIVTESEMLDMVDKDDHLDSFYLVDVNDLNNLKHIFCTVVTSDQFDSPMIFHTKTDSHEKANDRAREEMKELGWDPDQGVEIFSFEVNKNDITEI